MTTYAGQMSQTPTGNPQWRACNGAHLHSHLIPTPPQTARPHTPPSRGTYRDYWRNVGSHAGSHGINGWLVRLPFDPSGTWYISTADDSSEAAIPNAPTPLKPPPGVR
jgi:hypothetical protein